MNKNLNNILLKKKFLNNYFNLNFQSLLIFRKYDIDRYKNIQKNQFLNKKNIND